MATSSYEVRVEGPKDRDLVEEIERLKSELQASRVETAFVTGQLQATEGARKVLAARCGELQAKLYAAEGELGDQKDAIDELSFNARKDLGVRGRA